MLTDDLFLVSEDLAVELVDKQIDGGIHSVSRGIGVDDGAFGADVGLGIETLFLDMKYDVSGNDVVEVTLHAPDLFERVVA